MIPKHVFEKPPEQALGPNAPPCALCDKRFTPDDVIALVPAELAKMEETEVTVHEDGSITQSATVRGACVHLRCVEEVEEGSWLAVASLLKPPSKRCPGVCYCEPGKCMAPKIQGRQMPCLDPKKAGRSSNDA